MASRVNSEQGKSVKIDDLLSPARCMTTGGLPQYANCLRVNIGDGVGQTYAPVARLRRLTVHSLRMMNITQFEHQVLVMDAIRSYLAELDFKDNQEAKQKQDSAFMQTRAAAFGSQPQGDEFLLDGGSVYSQGSRGMESLGNASRGAASRGSDGNGSRGDGSRGSGRKEYEQQTWQALEKIEAARDSRGKSREGAENLRQKHGDESQVFSKSAAAGDGGASSSSEPTAVSHAISMPIFKSKYTALMEYLQFQTMNVKDTVTCGHVYVVHAEPRHHRFFWFKELYPNPSPHGGTSSSSLPSPSPSSPGGGGGGGGGVGVGGGARDGPAHAQYWPSSLPSGGLAALVLHSARPVTIHDCMHDNRFDGQKEVYLGLSSPSSPRAPTSPPVHPPKNLLAVPINPGQGPATADDMVGVLVLVNKKHPAGFTPQDEANALLAASQMASALEDRFYGLLETEIMREWLSARAHGHRGH